MSADPSRNPPPPPLSQPTAPLQYATPPPAAGVTDLRAVAIRQKAVMYCILAYLIIVMLRMMAVFGPFEPPLVLQILLGLLILAVVVTAAVFVFMLALALYNTATGIVLGLLTLIPLIGLIVLLIINGKATNVLRHHGLRVGLMGAKTSEIPAPGQALMPR